MQGQQVLVPGGTGGLGLGVVPYILAQGAWVTIPYRSMSAVERLQACLSPNELERVRFVECDLLQEVQVQGLVAGMGRVDALLHLAGGFAMGKTHEYSYTAWRQDFDLNLNSAFLVCKHVLARMLQQGYGRIVTVASRGAVEPGAQLAAYCASKAGLVALTRVIAAETKGQDITANVILPSVIDTPSNREAMGDAQASQWVSPASLAQLIGFLGSAAAKDIRGAVIPIYGNL
ncbi:MAG: 3-oxoacyl-ACP reductase FabG [Gloeomargaritaceae cyanobacterium C42_A2020_066]|nr:3-oxoacyl-ACP reductase FabG [Gloeomargaritaceae cyanobacterium C42_A2020_066]